MEVLKATTKQKNDLSGTYLNGHVLQFIQDADGSWVCGVGNVDNPNFAEIKSKLESLPRIPYKPKKITI